MTLQRSVTAALCIAFAFIVSPDLPGGEPETCDNLFKQEVDAMYPQWVQTRRDIHRHPELSNEEERTAKLVAIKLRELGLEVQTGVGKHGVVGLLRGDIEPESQCVAVRADMDALPIMEAGETPYRSEVHGVMHACGHDVHVTCALGVAELLAKHRDKIRGSVKFIFQGAEEAMPSNYVGDWGAKLMIEEGALENPRPNAIYGLHCSPLYAPKDGPGMGIEVPMEVGTIGYAIGPASANSDRFEIIIHGKIAHGSAPHKGVDAVVVAAHCITALQMVRSRETNTLDPVVLSIGMIKGGTRENIIADTVTMSGTVRSQDIEVRDQVIGLMHRTLAGVTSAHGATYELNYRKGYPAIENNEALALKAVETIERVIGKGSTRMTIPGMGGEDFSYFANVVPGFYYRLGVANIERGIVASVHTAEFDVDEESIKVGVLTMASIVMDHLHQ